MKTSGAAIFFAILALAATAPVWRSPSTLIIGNIEHPGLRGELFHQWDFCNQVREGRIASYYQSGRVSWPAGQDLRRFIGFSLHLFFYMPFLWLNDLILSYNLLTVATLALNGFAAFLLFRRTAGAYWPGLACGILFMLSPYAFLKLEQGFLQKAILWWLPLFLLFLLRFFENQRKRDAAWAGVFWLGALLTYAPYAWYAGLAALVLLALRAAKKHNRKKNQTDPQPSPQAEHPALLRRAWPMLVPAIIGVTFLALLLPGGGVRPPEGEIPVAVADAPIGSMDILHPFRFFPYAGFRAPVEKLPLGLSLSATVFALLALLRKRPQAGAFLALALVFLVLAIGPFLSARGEILARLPLPFYAVSLFAPWGRRLGYAIRVFPFIELAVLSLAAMALSGWRNNKTATTGLAFSLALLGFGLLEKTWLLPELFPSVITSAAISPDIAWLRDNSKIVLHLPYNVRGDEPHEYCYMTARSNTRMMNPYLDFRPQSFPTPPLPMPTPAAMADYLAGLRRSGATHLAIHLDALARPPRRWLAPAGNETVVEDYTAPDTEVFRAWCGAPLYENPGHLAVYAVPRMASIQSVLAAESMNVASSSAEQLLAKEARRLGLNRNPEIAEQVRAFEERLLVERLIEQKFLPRVRLSENDLREYFNAHLSNFQRAPQLRLFHLLVSLPPMPTPSQWAAAYQRAVSLLADVAGPVDKALELAETLARENASGARWGDMGYMTPGRLPPVVDEEIFSLTERGDVAMFESKAGFHLFRITDLRPGRNFTFEESRQAVKEQAERQALDREIRQWTRLQAANTNFPHDNMVALPGGSFWMGSTPEEIDRATAMAARFVGRTREVKREWFEDETLRYVTVAPFELDKYEVTVGEYRAFLKATGRPPPPCRAQQDEPLPDNFPVTGVTWNEAAAYAKWLGKRLPTAEEWEWAARGEARRFFPWGENEPDGTRANYADKNLPVPHNDPEHDDGFKGLAPIGSFPSGATPENIFDMAGNAREWTSTQALGIIDPADHHIWAWENRPAHLRKEAILPEPMRVVKGGSFDSAADDLRTADVRMLPPETRHESLGFRCARDMFFTGFDHENE